MDKLDDLIRERLDISDAEKKKVKAEKDRIKSINGVLLKDGMNPVDKMFKYVELRNRETGGWDIEGSFHFCYELIPALCKILHNRHRTFTIDFLESCMDGRPDYFSQGSRRSKFQNHKVEGTDIYVRTHFNNNEAVKFCYRIARCFDYSKSDLNIYLDY